MKNETIEKMRLEIERMRKLLASQTGTISQKNGDSSTSLSNQVEDYLVTDVVTFDDDNQHIEEDQKVSTLIKLNISITKL